MRAKVDPVRTRGFTLLEAVIALIILSSFVVACLQLRLNGLRAGRAVAEAQRVERAIDDVLTLATSRLLPEPIVERDAEGDVARIIWRGEHAGMPFECISQRGVAPAVGDNVNAASIPVQQYTVTIEDRTVVVFRPLPPSRTS